MLRRSAHRLIQLRRGAVRGAPSPPYIWIAIAVIVCLAVYQWYQQHQADQRAAQAEPRNSKPAAAPSETPAKSSQQPVVLVPSVTASSKSASPAKQQPAPNKPTERHTANPNAGKYRVTHIADGDTINLEGRHRVRLIGINCAEIGHPEKDPPTKAQPWSAEAMKFTEARLKNQMVRIEFDPEYDAEDHYGRWLCWVYYRDQRDGSEKLLNEELLRAGLAFAYDDRRKFHYSEAMYRRLKAAQREAQEGKRGIYSTR